MKQNKHKSTIKKKNEREVKRLEKRLFEMKEELKKLDVKGEAHFCISGRIVWVEREIATLKY